jgi:hypothetical protein
VTADPVMGYLRIRWFTCSWPLTLAVLAELAMPAQGRRPGFVALTSGTFGPPAGPGVLVGACGGVGDVDGPWVVGLGLGDCFGDVAGL